MHTTQRIRMTRITFGAINMKTLVKSLNESLGITFTMVERMHDWLPKLRKMQFSNGVMHNVYQGLLDKIDEIHTIESMAQMYGMAIRAGLDSNSLDFVYKGTTYTDREIGKLSDVTGYNAGSVYNLANQLVNKNPNIAVAIEEALRTQLVKEKDISMTVQFGKDFHTIVFVRNISVKGEFNETLIKDAIKAAGTLGEADVKFRGFKSGVSTFDVSLDYSAKLLK